MENPAWTRVFSFAEIIDGTFRFYRRFFWPIFCFSFVICFPTQLPVAWWDFQVFKQWYATTSNPMEDWFPLEEWFPVFIVNYVIDFFFLYPFLQIFCFRLLETERKEGKVSVPIKSIFSLGFRKIGKSFFSHLLLCTGFVFLYFFICLFLSALGKALFGAFSDAEEFVFWFSLAFGFFLVHAVGIFLFIRFALIIPVIEAEQSGVLSAFRRSWELTRFSVWSIFGMLFAIFLVSLPFSFAGPGLEQMLQGWIPPQSDLFWEWINQLLLLLINPILMPIPCILFSIVYWNQRAMKEAYDLIRLIRG